MSLSYRGENRELNQVTRRGVDGAFIQLTKGVTHYELGGPRDGQPIVLVHGFSTPYFIFDPTSSALTRAGFCVLRYDLFGRGWSDRPLTAYDLDLFVRQLSDLLDVLDLKLPVSLLGLSMGGPITTAFLSKYPGRVSKHILIDPAGVRPYHFSPLLSAVLLPGIGELALSLMDSDGMLKDIASDIFTPNLVGQLQKKFKVQMQYKGYRRALLSTIRNGMLGSFIDIYRRAGKLQKPTLIIWGQNDRAIPPEQSHEFLAAVPHAELHIIDNCGHIPHYEKPAEVNPLLIRFLEDQPNHTSSFTDKKPPYDV